MESDMVQENCLVAYYPLPMEVLKEEPQSGDGQTGYDSDEQVISAPQSVCQNNTFIFILNELLFIDNASAGR